MERFVQPPACESRSCAASSAAPAQPDPAVAALLAASRDYFALGADGRPAGPTGATAARGR